jgi:hypothetical protein
MRNALILFTLLSAATLVAAQESSAPPSRYEFFPAWSPGWIDDRIRIGSRWQLGNLHKER